MVPVAEAAKIVGLSEDAVYRRIKRGLADAELREGRRGRLVWYVDPATLPLDPLRPVRKRTVPEDLLVYLHCFIRYVDYQRKQPGPDPEDHFPKLLRMLKGRVRLVENAEEAALHGVLREVD